MNDLEMTKACAEAMGYRISDDSRFAESGLWCHLPAQHGEWYRPLSGDTYGNAQAMALVKKFRLNIGQLSGGQCQVFSPFDAGHIQQADSKDLNRAIVECVAKLKERL